MIASKQVPKYTGYFPLNDYTNEQFLILIIEAVKLSGWRIKSLNPDSIIIYTQNGIFSWNADIRVGINEGIAHITSKSSVSELNDLGKNKKNVTAFIDTLIRLGTQYTVGNLDEKFHEASHKWMVAGGFNRTLPTLTAKEQFIDFISIFKPSHGYYISPVILDLNLLIFLLMALTGVNIIAPGTQSLLNWGANYGPLTSGGEWWRLLTCCFLHIGIVHLVMNMFALLMIGLCLEPVLGKARFLTAYLLTGITASLTSLWWHGGTISAGASGAIFGMYGVFLALLTSSLIEKTTRKRLLLSIGFFVVYNLLNGLKAGIDNAAHTGGLVTGIVTGYLFLPGLKKQVAKNSR